MLPVNMYVCANHFISDCFSNECEYKAGLASTLTLIKGSVPTIPDPATATEPQVKQVWKHVETGERETMLTVSKSLKTVLKTNTAFASC